MKQLENHVLMLLMSTIMIITPFIPGFVEIELNTTEVTVSDRSTEEHIVNCSIINSTQSNVTLSWENENYEKVSNNGLLTLSASLYQNSMNLTCVASFGSNDTEYIVFLSYTVVVTNSFIEEILEINDTIDGEEALDFIEIVFVIANGNITIIETNELLEATINIFTQVNVNSLNNEMVVQLSGQALDIVSSISNELIDESTNLTAQENLSDNIADYLDSFVDLINLLPDNFTDPIQISIAGNSLISRIIINTTDDVEITLNSTFDNGSVSINISPNIFQSPDRATRVTALAFNSRNSLRVSVPGLGSGSIGSITSLSIEGVDENDLISTPINITYTMLENISDKSSYTCIFRNVTSQVWESTGITTVFDRENGVVACLTSHLTSFAVLTLTRESTAGEIETQALRVVSFFLLSFSLVALLISLILFLLSGRRFFDVEMNRMYFNYALALTFAISSFIFGVNFGVVNHIFCVVLTTFVHYFWLSVFSWGLCIAILITYLLTIGVLNRKNLFWPLFILGWTLPIPIVIITMIIGLVRDNYVRTDELCFLSLDYIWAFIGPIIIIIILNTLCFIISIVRIIQTSRSNAVSKKKANLTAIKNALISSSLLLPILSVPWIVLILDLLFSAAKISTTFYEWIFFIFIAPSGVVFLATFTLQDQSVRNTLKGQICGKDSPISITEPVGNKFSHQTPPPNRPHALPRSKANNIDSVGNNCSKDLVIVNQQP